MRFQIVPLATLTVAFLASNTMLSAQTVPVALTAPPALIVQINGHSVPLTLAKLETNVRIYGPAAETTSTMTFSNPNARPMEGELYFPLPEVSTISGYALDINGMMIDGVAVEKHEARRIFEEVERHGIDPGLIQWTKGNNFQTRVFPIPANGTRTIRVSYVSEISGGKDSPAYHLPLAFKDKVGEFSLRVEVVKPGAVPRVAKGELSKFQFAAWHESFVAETKLRDWSAVEDLVIALPKSDGPKATVEKADDGQYYFAVEDHPTRPNVAESTLAVSQHNHIVVYWDASGSRSGDHSREISLLGKYLAKLTERVTNKDTIKVDLVLFRNVPAAPIRIDFDRDHQSALSDALAKVQYDGGTQLGALGPLPLLQARGEKPDLYLLFTDGISDFGRSEPAAFDAPLSIFSAAATSDHAVLRNLAQANGGQYFNLANWKDADVLAQAGKAVWSFLSTEVTENAAHETYPKEPEPLGGRFLLAGRLTGDSATLILNYGEHGGPTAKRTVKVSKADAVEGTLLRRLWAQKKLAHLMIHEQDNQSEITALGKRLNLVTPFTSLLVLENLDQYVQYEVAPPKSLAAMREEYVRRVDTIEHQKQKVKADKLAEVLALWQHRVDWWNNEFKYAKDFKYKGEQVVQASESDRPMAAPGGGLGGRMSAPQAGMRGNAGAHDEAANENPFLPFPAAAQPSPSAPMRHDVAGATRAIRAPAPVPAGGESNLRLQIVQSQEAVPAPEITAGVRASDRHIAAQSDLGNNGLIDRFDSLMLDGRQRTLSNLTSGQRSSQQPGIAIKPWQPDMPYLKELQAAHGKAEQFAVYMKNRTQYGTAPAYFLDCADFFRAAGEHDLALQVLSNIAELQLEEAALLRILAHRLEQIGEIDLAVQTFEQVLHLRPEEPQSYRDLALVLAHRGDDKTRNAEQVLADYARAVELLVEVVNRRWDQRFPEIEVIALEEVNHLIPRARAAGVSTIPLDPRLIKLLDFDVRIVMTWHADNTDIDLWVTEPTEEKAFYQHNRTTIGGLVSADFTQGYGPEEYLVRKAAHGIYKIDANYYGSRATRLFGPVTVQVDVFSNYGRPNEQRKSMTLRLKDAQETVRIGEIEF